MKPLSYNPRIQFGYRTKDNKHNSNVLEDFFAMMDFDALIRSGSHYSAMAGVLGGISYEVSPASYRWEGKKLIIPSVDIVERNGELCELWLTFPDRNKNHYK